MNKPDISASAVLHYLYKQGGSVGHMCLLNDYIQDSFSYDVVGLKKLLDSLREEGYIYIHQDYAELGTVKNGKRLDLKKVPVKVQLRLPGFNKVNEEKKERLKLERAALVDEAKAMRAASKAVMPK